MIHKHHRNSANLSHISICHSLSYNPCISPGDNSTHSNFQATKTIWIACMHACVGAHTHTHTHSVLHKYTKTKPFIHHLSPSLTYTPTHTHIHSSINAQKQNPLFPLSLTHTYIHTEMLSLLLTHLHIHRDAPPPSNHTRRQMLSLSCTHLHREHP